MNRHNKNLRTRTASHMHKSSMSETPQKFVSFVPFPTIRFTKSTATKILYPKMLKNWLLSKLQADCDVFVLRQDGAPLHWLKAARAFLNMVFLRRWIGRKDGFALHNWPSKSPDLTVCKSSFWEFVKDSVFAPLFQQLWTN